MFLADYHVHSTCSFDAKNRMAEMARVSKQRGMAEVCFTDHCDFGVPETMQIGPDSFTLPKQQAHQYIEALEKAPEGIFMTLGLELGEGGGARGLHRVGHRREPSASTPCRNMTSSSAPCTT